MNVYLIIYASVVMLLLIMAGTGNDVSEMDDIEIVMTVLLILFFPITFTVLFFIGLMALGKKIRKWSGK